MLRKFDFRPVGNDSAGGRQAVLQGPGQNSAPASRRSQLLKPWKLNEAHLMQNTGPIFGSPLFEDPSIRHPVDHARVPAYPAACGWDAPELSLVGSFDNKAGGDGTSAFDQVLLGGMNIGKTAKKPAIATA
jgi:hypothetical protein